MTVQNSYTYVLSMVDSNILSKSDEIDDLIPSKRCKISTEDDLVTESTFSTPPHRVGAVRRLSLRNFVIYTEADIFPGPQLNIIVGPNGTGKSSLVCALVLVLGGKPNILGRGKELRDFIKLNCDEACIEIELVSPAGTDNLVITRHLFKDNSSTWKINGLSVKSADVISTVKALNIQVDNLCQFLPQDRISSFAAMNSIEILRHTELAIGGDDLYKQHMELAESKVSKKSMLAEYIAKGERLKRLKSMNKEIESDYLRLQERESYIDDLTHCENKCACLLLKDLRQKTLQLQKKLKKKDQEIEVKEMGLNPIKEEIKIKEAETKGCGEKVDEINTLSGSLHRKYNDLIESNLSAEAKTISIEEEISKLKQREQKRNLLVIESRNKIQSLQQRLAQARVTYNENMASKHKMMEERRQLKAEEMNLLQELKVLSLSRRNLDEKSMEMNTKLKALDDISQMRERVLSDRFKNVILIHKWVKASSQNGQLRRPIYGPLLFEINTKDPNHASFLEHILGELHLTSFIVLCEEDRTALLNYARSQSLKVPLVMYNPNPHNNFQYPVPLDELMLCGVQGYLDQILDADEIVKNELCRQCRLNQIPYGSEELEGQSQAMSKFVPLRIQSYMTPKNVYRTILSKYNQDSRPTMVEQLKKPRYLIPMDIKAQEMVCARALQIEQKKVEMDELIGSKTRRRDEILAYLEQLVKDISLIDVNILSTIENYIKRAEQDLQDNMIDFSKELSDLERHFQESIHSRLPICEKLHQMIAEIIKTYHLHTESILKRSETTTQLGELRTALHMAENEYTDWYQQRQELHDQLLLMKKKTLAQQEVAAKHTPKEKDKGIWLKLPCTVDELKTMITQLQVKINIISNDPDLITKYRNRVQKISEIEEEIATFEKSLQEKQSEIEALKAAWLDKIESKVHDIHTNFSAFFNEIDCQGKVVLAKDPDDCFEKYGIEIWVSYRRNESMSKLSAQTQSGGERSVATMLYLIALQNLADCPFRLVDEINQGMDHHNERMVFDRVVKQASKENTPQYFLITPKLLPDLNFKPCITIHCIFNGPYTQANIDWVESVNKA